MRERKRASGRRSWCCVFILLFFLFFFLFYTPYERESCNPYHRAGIGLNVVFLSLPHLHLHPHPADAYMYVVFCSCDPFAGCAEGCRQRRRWKVWRRNLC
jgi:hypothetical protein